MNTQAFQIEVDDSGYMVIGSKGIIARFSSLDAAYDALQEFRNKSFPENWSKVPPAIQAIKRLYQH